MAIINDIDLGEFPLFLSPMDDITDLPFRQLCKRHGADVLISEFIASEALIRDVEKSRRKMLFDPSERPIGIQVFGNEEDAMLRCIDVVAEAQPDFIDINWGCPVRKVAGKGGGSGMLKDIPKLLKITAALVQRSPLPVTVKTRLGYDANDKPIVTLAEQLQDIGVAAVSIHGRTKTQMYSGTADWTLIAQTKANPRLHIPVFGNGDIATPQQAAEARRRYGVDGILIGRAAIGNPWIFGQCKQLMFNQVEPRPVGVAQRVDVCREHLLAAVEFKGEHTAIFEMRKHYGNYFKGLPNFKQFRIPLVTLTSLEETLQVLDEIKNYYTTE
ncbi:MAG: tRNA dihydrouridine synthase DusB [Bacteroidales bacterium]|nr:tRNA dihydrouridine synthase DusB [Bacteroidales bacterium]